tara:strand:- start:39327 stop:39518 length:192 start_codon:yes stop_codon:yes gene_type:complete
MTCTSCEEHLNYSILQLDGILDINSSYKNGAAKMAFDITKTTIEGIEKIINSIGYSTLNIKQE